MGPKSSKIGLATKAGDFDEALVSHLSELLDQEDDTPLQLDWRTLAQRMGLKDESRQRLARTEKKTKTALRLWSYEEPENCTARELVRILLDMGRRDAALAVQSHLAERYEPGRSPLEDQFQEVDTAARFGQLEEVTRLVGDKLVMFRSSIQLDCNHECRLHNIELLLHVCRVLKSRRCFRLVQASCGLRSTQLQSSVTYRLSDSWWKRSSTFSCETSMLHAHIGENSRYRRALKLTLTHAVLHSKNTIIACHYLCKR